MRLAAILRTLPVLLLLTGCPEPKTSVESPSAPPVTEAQVVVNPPNLPAEQFVGSWATADSNGQAFDIVLFPNGQAISTVSKGTVTSLGERGLWRTTPQGATAFFADGRTDQIIANGDGFLHLGYASDHAPGGPPTSQSPAVRTEGAAAGFIGVWRLNKEADGSYLFVVLQSSGRAFSNVNGEGNWEATPEGARCKWPDGWNDLIFRSPEGYQKRSWVGPEQNTTPPDVSPAIRVGEARFQISP